MPTVTQHSPGMFSWADLSTSDPAAAKAFYTAVFGWTFEDNPAGPDQIYSMAKAGGQTAAALFKQRREDSEQGIAPHWTCYFTVTDVDAQAARVAALGGTLARPPFDVFDAGRMCMVSDPAGAVSALWQPNKHIGASVMGDHGSLGWAELWTRDEEASGRFYQQLHRFERVNMPSHDDTAYSVFNIGTQPSCGMKAMPEELPASTASHWIPYFCVDDCDRAIATAKSAGAGQLGPTLNIPRVGRFATLVDPQGAAFAVIRSSD